LQLSAKALLKPFNAALSDKTTEDDEQVTNDFTIFEDEGGDEGEDEEQLNDMDADHGIDDLQDLSEDDQNQIMAETAAFMRLLQVCMPP